MENPWFQYLKPSGDFLINSFDYSYILSVLHTSVMFFWFCHRFEFCLLRQYHDRCFILSIASSLDTMHLSLICSVWLHGLFLHDICSSPRHWKDLISLSLFSLPPPSFCLLSLFSLSSLCRGGALSDGWSAQTDSDPAWRDGEHVVMVVVVVLLKSALLKPREEPNRLWAC